MLFFWYITLLLTTLFIYRKYLYVNVTNYNNIDIFTNLILNTTICTNIDILIKLIYIVHTYTHVHDI